MEKTLGQLYLEIKQQTGKVAPQLEGAELPAAGQRIFVWFGELSAARQHGFSGVQPIAWSEVRNYFDLIGERPQPWQLRLLRSLDSIYVQRVSEEVELGGQLSGADALRQAAKPR